MKLYTSDVVIRRWRETARVGAAEIVDLQAEKLADHVWNGPSEYVVEKFY